MLPTLFCSLLCNYVALLYLFNCYLQCMHAYKKGKGRPQAQTSSMDADSENTSSSSQDGSSCDYPSCKEESPSNIETHHKGSNEVCPVNTDSEGLP